MRLILSIILFLAVSVEATQLRLTTLYLPLYFYSDIDEEQRHQSIPFVTSYASPEALLGAMSQPYIPHHDTSWGQAGDVNLVTIYKLKLTFSQVEDSFDYLMVIDASKSKRPDKMPFTINEVIEKTKKCATLNYPTSAKSKLRFSVIGFFQK